MKTKSDYLDHASGGRSVLRTLAALSLGLPMAFAGNTAMAPTIKDGGDAARRADRRARRARSGSLDDLHRRPGL